MPTVFQTINDEWLTIPQGQDRKVLAVSTRLPKAPPTKMSRCRITLFAPAAGISIPGDFESGVFVTVPLAEIFEAQVGLISAAIGLPFFVREEMPNNKNTYIITAPLPDLHLPTGAMARIIHELDNDVIRVLEESITTSWLIED